MSVFGYVVRERRRQSRVVSVRTLILLWSVVMVNRYDAFGVFGLRVILSAILSVCRPACLQVQDFRFEETFSAEAKVPQFIQAGLQLFSRFCADYLFLFVFFRSLFPLFRETGSVRCRPCVRRAPLALCTLRPVDICVSAYT